MATAALGAGILEGKTAGWHKGRHQDHFSKTKRKLRLQMDIAKIAAADERERNRLNIMRQDLANKLKITDKTDGRELPWPKSLGRLLNDRTRLMTEEGADTCK